MCPLALEAFARRSGLSSQAMLSQLFSSSPRVLLELWSAFSKHPQNCKLQLLHLCMCEGHQDTGHRGQGEGDGDPRRKSLFQRQRM